MIVTAAQRGFLKALALGESKEADKFNDEIAPEERDAFHVLVTAFYSIMLEQRFQEDAGLADVRAFVEEMRYDYRDLEVPIKPMMIEALIRASLGEEHLFDDIPGEETLRAEFLVIGKIAEQSSYVHDNIDSVITDAEALAREWESEED